MRFNRVGIEQLSQLVDAMVAAENHSGSETPRCFGLVGTLGAGKTRLCQEIARACGIDPADVTSPTFTLIKSYDCSGDEISGGRPMPRSLHHLDLYRVANEDELWELGLEELWETPGCWTLIEWADRFADCLPEHTIWVRIEIEPSVSHEEPSLRTIEFECQTAEQTEWMEDVRSRC